jgi:hypothetical protein
MINDTLLPRLAIPPFTCHFNGEGSSSTLYNTGVKEDSNDPDGHLDQVRKGAGEHVLYCEGI